MILGVAGIRIFGPYIRMGFLDHTLGRLAWVFLYLANKSVDLAKEENRSHARAYTRTLELPLYIEGYQIKVNTLSCN